MTVRERPALVAHIGQVPEAGSFVTADAAGAPLLVIRQDDGSVRIVANVCRHRGARVETEAAGRRKMFACPYHRWCYTRTGALRSIPFEDGFAGAGRADLSLVEHPSAVTGNLVWVVPDRSAVPSVSVPADIADAAFVRAAVLETGASWAEVEASVGGEPLAAGTFVRWVGGFAELVSVRPAGPRLDRTVIGLWFLSGPDAGLDIVPQWEQRGAELRELWA